MSQSDVCLFTIILSVLSVFSKVFIYPLGIYYDDGVLFMYSG